MKPVPLRDLTPVARAIWVEVAAHPSGASCECPATAAVKMLERLGYEIIPPKVQEL